MPHVYVATLGQRPEAITIALDMLLQNNTYSRAVILHTDPTAPELVKAYTDLHGVMATDYPFMTQWREIRHENGSPITDIDTRATADAYFKGMYTILRDIKNSHVTIHMLLSGGPKSMNCYETLAASVLFGQSDRVWTMVSPDSIMQPGQFHMRPKDQRKVALVDLPLVLARFTPGTQPEDVDIFLKQRRDLRATFLKKLSDEEHNVIDMLLRNRYLTNQELARLMGKSTRTVENQLHSAYGKLVAYLDYGEDVKDKKRMLLDFLNSVE